MPDTYIKFDGVDGESFDTRDTFDFTTEEETSEGLLLPAVQAAREAARSDSEGQDGSDLLIVNNGDGSDFLEVTETDRDGSLTGDWNGDGGIALIDDMAIL